MSSPSSNIKVACVGAGYAGLALARSILHSAPGAQLTIYEADEGVGGVWRKTSYPGAGSDFPSHLYALPWALNPDWARFYSTRPEILAYLERVAEQSGFLPYIQFKHSVQSAVWQEQDGLWHISGTRASAQGEEEWHAKAHVLVNAGGILSKSNVPSLPGAESFKGQIVHTSQWNDDILVANKRVAVIGAGASAIQIVPALQRLGVGHTDLYVRSQAWIGTPFNFAERDANFKQEAENFGTLFTNDVDIISRKNNATPSGTPRAMLNSIENALTGLARAKLAVKPELESSFIPEFSFGCRRPTPGPGFFETITGSNVDVIQRAVDRLTKTGIVAAGDDKERAVDLVILATGYKVDHVPPFELVGRSGSSLRGEWAKSPRGYLSLATPDMPNYFTIAGPQHPSANGSLSPY
ncbi:Flavin-containing monooxygenase [Ceraceosorus bombacis]|uniref:Flavin-containing monooxygenase n=1 Tax=Ceraceosorus bombacis TaxID=401625 RepID=A0A0P1BGM0_9BASI|nr:Flavin-containing monooxygenase [Ceraceosorus bombacis]